MKISKKTLKSIIALLMAAFFCLILIYFNNSDKKKYVDKSNNSIEMIKNKYQFGAWYWKSPDEISEQESDKILDFAQKEGINTIYIEIGKIADLNSNNDKDKEIVESFTNSLNTFVKKANNKNIKVHALSGATNWANDSHNYIPLKLLEYVIKYNVQDNNAKISGIQYDIEFYNQKNYKANNVEEMQKFLRLSDEIIQKANSSQTDVDFAIGFAVPYWIDSNNSLMPDLNYNGVRKPFMAHLFDVLKKRNNSYLAIMAYRNIAGGDNGTISLVSEEFKYLKDNNIQNVKLLIGQETSNAEEEGENVSFFRKSKTELLDNLSLIEKAYQDHPNLEGFAIHDLNSFIELAKK